ncbi:unnamed protein product, partial [Prorocentrum cordatum]
APPWCRTRVHDARLLSHPPRPVDARPARVPGACRRRASPRTAWPRRLPGAALRAAVTRALALPARALAGVRAPSGWRRGMPGARRSRWTW